MQKVAPNDEGCSARDRHTLGYVTLHQAPPSITLFVRWPFSATLFLRKRPNSTKKALFCDVAVIFTQIESQSVAPILRDPKYFIGPRPTHSFVKMASGTVDREMEQFILAEKEKVRFQSLVRSLTDECWEKCVEKVGSKLDSKTETCLVNCVERFLDTSNFVANRLSQMGES